MHEYSARLGLSDPELTAFEEYLWELPVAFRAPETFDAWHDSAAAVCLASDSDPGRAALLTRAAAVGVPPADLSSLLEAVAEIVFGSFYAAAHDAESLVNLEVVLTITGGRGVVAPPPSLVAASLFRDGHGWGNLPTQATLSGWRHASAAA